MSEAGKQSSGHSESMASSVRKHKLLMRSIPFFILAIGIAIATFITLTPPKAPKQRPVKTAPYVQVETVRKSVETVVISAMGTVIPAREIVLQSRVTGEIIATHPEFIEGGLLKAGEEILRIDPKDYELAVETKQSSLINARSELKMELGHQDVAEREWELLNGDNPGKSLDAELALRKPHLEKAKANMAAAEADLKQAKLDLSRTVITAPFNAILRSKNADIGSQVSPQDHLADLVGTDEYWIQASVPLDRLQWIVIPRVAEEKGSFVRIMPSTGLQENHNRTGTVIKLQSDLETEGRMARLLISVTDPLDLTRPELMRSPFLIGDFIKIEIEGRSVDNVIRIPRIALRDNVNVWVVGEDGTLDIRIVNWLWRDKETVFVQSSLSDGERIIISDLATPVAGMPLRIKKE